MIERKRPRSKDPARVVPLRDFARLYRDPGALTGDSNSRSRASAPEARPKGPGSDQPSRGVGLAYRVIDKYISDARKAAAQFSSQSYRTGAAIRPFQELVDSMLRYQAEMLPLWLDLLGSLTRVDSFRTAYSAGSEARAMNNSTVARRNVSIELTSRRPVEISVDIDQDSTNAALVTPGLHPFDKNKPGLTEIRFVPGNARKRSRLCIKIPDRQPAGLYSGVVVDPKSGETRGTLSIRVADDHSRTEPRSK